MSKRFRHLLDDTFEPPYSLLLIPDGDSPLPNDVEVRSVQNIPFPGNSTTLSFTVSDITGIGSGGVNIPEEVLPSSDSSCYNPTQSARPPWTFNIKLLKSGITQCDSVRWWWLPGAVQGNVSFFGVIPGVKIFNMIQGPLSTDKSTGTGFDWTIDLANDTDIIVFAGDDRGIGSGGFVGYTVSSSSNVSCLSSTSSSSTVYVHTISNTRAIAGGVAGGLALIVAFASIAFFYARRLGYAAISKERPVNVLHDDEDGDGSYQDLPDHYIVEPYLVTDPKIGGPSVDASRSGRLLSITPAYSSHPQGITAPVTTMRKNALPAPLRPTNIIQHDDAGPREGPASVGEPETIELPPAYTNVR
ncbi:hypothetical protein EI94DRAFT_1791471 [Lactarius quietus]|nr:hypothetical protein EI94DRAFT_1791471 [Lactarius quietus]